MVMPILEGLDGKQKMSKSLGNYIALNESPRDMFGKIMSISDELMATYYEILLQEEASRRTSIRWRPRNPWPSASPRAFHSEEAAAAARVEFETRFSKKNLDDADLPAYTPQTEARDFVSLVVEAYAQCFAITKTRGDARRLIEGGSIQWKGEKVSDAKAVLPTGEAGVLKLDKTRAVRSG